MCSSDLIAVSTDTWLVITGATIGIILLRFMADLFIRWLDEYTHLEDAGVNFLMSVVYS